MFAQKLNVWLIILVTLGVFFCLLLTIPAMASLIIGAVVFIILLLLRKIFIHSQSSRLIIPAILLSSVVFQSGCTVNVPLIPQMGDLKIKQRLPIDAALLITKETKEYMYRGTPESFTGSARPHEFYLGQALETASMDAFAQVFEKVVLVRSVDDAQKFKIYIKPSIEEFHFEYDQLRYAGFAVCVLSKIKVNVILTSGNKKVWEKSVESPQQKRGPWFINFSYEEEVGKAASDALVFALGKIAQDISEDSAIRQFIQQIEPQGLKHLLQIP